MSKFTRKKRKKTEIVNPQDIVDFPEKHGVVTFCGPNYGEQIVNHAWGEYNSLNPSQKKTYKNFEDYLYQVYLSCFS